MTNDQVKLLRRIETGKASAVDKGAIAAMALHVRRLDVTDDEAARIERAAERSR